VYEEGEKNWQQKDGSPFHVIISKARSKTPEAEKAGRRWK
jgi:hypothetical protein